MFFIYLSILYSTNVQCLLRAFGIWLLKKFGPWALRYQNGIWIPSVVVAVCCCHLTHWSTYYTTISQVSPTGGLTCQQRSTVGRPPTVDLELSTTNSHNHPKALTRKSAPIEQFFTIDRIGSDNSLKKLKNQTDSITKKW